ncbi:MAG TPA: hypothetical protein DEA08_34910 [Planctomycetes bacterium]|nr:hypothetical protein [Planctomycetota bacterium]
MKRISMASMVPSKSWRSSSWLESAPTRSSWFRRPRTSSAAFSISTTFALRPSSRPSSRAISSWRVCQPRICSASMGAMSGPTRPRLSIPVWIWPASSFRSRRRASWSISGFSSASRRQRTATMSSRSSVSTPPWGA